MLVPRVKWDSGQATILRLLHTESSLSLCTRCLWEPRSKFLPVRKPIGSAVVRPSALFAPRSSADSFVLGGSFRRMLDESAARTGENLRLVGVPWGDNWGTRIATNPTENQMQLPTILIQTVRRPERMPGFEDVPNGRLSARRHLSNRVKTVLDRSGQRAIYS